MSNPQEEKDKIISSHDLVKELATLPKQQSFPSGFSTLDEMVQGFRESDLIIISGLTGHGKSQLMVSFARKMIESKPLIFSYEITTQELFERFGENIPLFYLPRINTSSAPQWIHKKIVEAKEKYGTKVVFIDHLHYLVDTATIRNKNSSELIGSMCRDLKQIARKERVCLFLLCHVRKITSKDGRPTINDLKDSSGISQESDVVLIIHRKGKRRTTEDEPLIANEATLYVDKVRHHFGRLGSIGLQFTEDGFYTEL